MKKTLIALMALAGVAMGDTYWSFEGNLNSAGDKTYTGTPTGSVTMLNTNTTSGDVLSDDSDCTLGYGVKFVNGSYVKYDNAADIVSQMKVGTSGTADFTVMAYVNFATIPNGVNDSNVFFFGTGTGHSGIALGIADSGKLDFLVKGINHHEWDNVPVSANTWYHLAFAYNSTNNAVELFVNGTSNGSITLRANGSGTYYNTPSNTIMLGASGTEADAMKKFDGQLAHLQIVTGQALGAEEVKQYATTIIPEPATATLSLLALCGLAARRRRK